MQDPFDTDTMIFGPLDLDGDVQPWHAFDDIKPYPDVDPYLGVIDPYADVLAAHHWLTDPEITAAAESLFPSPSDFDRLLLQPRSPSPPPPCPPCPPRHRLLSAVPTPTWAAQLWDSNPRPPSPPARSSVRPSAFADATLRPTRRGSVHVLTSSSAPLPFSHTRSFTRSCAHDRDATLRRKQKPEDDPDMRELWLVFSPPPSPSSLTLPPSSQTRPQTSQTRPFRLAALFHRLDPASAGLRYQAQCRSGCQGSGPRIRFPLSPR